MAEKFCGRDSLTGLNRKTRRPAKPRRIFRPGVVRDELGVHPRSLQILRDAMLADVKSSEGTGTAAAVDGLQICGKTGTAEVQDEHNQTSAQFLVRVLSRRMKIRNTPSW